jgi:DNA-binding NtrC family response regulator
MLKNIFFATKNEFLSLAIREAMKKQALDCYTLTSTKDCFYLIEDLKPQLFVIDAELFLEEESLFLKGLKDKNIHVPLILCGTSQEWDSFSSTIFLGHLQKPLAPFQVKELLEKIYLPH